MRRLSFLIAAVALSASLGIGSAIAADPIDDLGKCNGAIDVACWYYDPYPYRTFCTLWLGNSCFIG